MLPFGITRQQWVKLVTCLPEENSQSHAMIHFQGLLQGYQVHRYPHHHIGTCFTVDFHLKIQMTNIFVRHYMNDM